ncbi:hypothetical protein Psyaliredsea_31410 [Psychrobacter alimentarius]
MTKPAKRTQKDKIGIYIKRQAWILFILILIVWTLDTVWLNSSQLTIAKSTAIGALLSFVTQAVFAFLFFGIPVIARANILLASFTEVRWPNGY